MTRRTSRELLIAAGGLLAAFAALTLYVRFHGPIPGDGRSLDYAKHHGVLGQGQHIADLYALLAALGSPTVGLFTTLGAAIIVFTNIGARPAALVLASALIVLAEKPLSNWVGTTDAAAQLGLPGGGYPSGHLLYVTAVFGMFAVLGRRYGRPEVTFVAVVLILGMPIERVVSGAHLVDETIGGALLGGAWLCAVLAADAARP